MSVRKSVRIDPELMNRVHRLVPPRGFNQFVNEALAARVDAVEQSRLEERMREGYLAVEQDRRDLQRDWQVVDRESWPA